MSTLDLSSPGGALRNFMRVRASLDGSDVVTWFAGSVSAMIPGEPWRGPLLGFEGYNVARAVPAEGGFDLLSREAAFYLDPRSGQILRSWSNPSTGEDVDVIHVWNDPVNFRFREQMPHGPFRVPFREMNGTLFFTSDVFLAYPSPLPRAQFPDNSQNDTYQAAELFGFTCDRADLEGDAPGVPATVSWTRIAPWLPWMRMADRPGQLVYHCEGMRLGSFNELPDQVRAEVEENDARYRTAPTDFTEPNETSWTYFRKLVSS